MQRNLAAALLAFVTDSMACTLPTTTLSNTITEGFGLLIQNPAFPVIHDRYMNLAIAGGGDKHLFLSPVPEPAFNMVLGEGVLAQGGIHALIGGERNEPRAIFQPIWSCDTDTDNVVVQLAFQTWQGALFGGLICVRQASGFRGYEFRYSPPANPAYDPTNPCMPVTMVVVSSTSLTLLTTTPTTTSPSTSDSTSSSSTSTSTSTSSPLPYTDMTSKGFSFLGCSPEERRATDGPGRTLNGALYAEDTLTNGKCIDFCVSNGYLYAGSEYARECWCGNTVAPGRVPATTKASLANCSKRCGGDASEYCGGDAWLSLYRKCDVGGACVNAVFT
ncbi:WSC domain-containing protein [Amylocarpus encephaloides]|uniref:WSC domain-containing protein n=1 Tax=Amylocarpus encephaloides TaxID=45428 RepID=A0A9P7YTQ1_9HELO|nr:WSC domain-containing protein [Amylocarpus encephaloides]